MPGVGENGVFRFPRQPLRRIVAFRDWLSAPVNQINNQSGGATRGTKSAVPTWKTQIFEQKYYWVLSFEDLSAQYKMLYELETKTNTTHK